MSDHNVGASVATAACAVFCVVLIFLALQMRAGDDPAIGAGPVAKAPQPRKAIVRPVGDRSARAPADSPPVTTRAS